MYVFSILAKCLNIKRIFMSVRLGGLLTFRKRDLSCFERVNTSGTLIAGTLKLFYFYTALALLLYDTDGKNIYTGVVLLRPSAELKGALRLTRPI